MDSWRLSKIEEELERLETPQSPSPEFPPPPPSICELERSTSREHTPGSTLERLGKSRTLERGRSLTPSGTLDRSWAPGSATLERGRSMTPSGALERSHSFSNAVDCKDVTEEIYSKIVVKKGYSREDLEEEAVKHFSGKYESPGKVILGPMSPQAQPKYKDGHNEENSLPTVFPDPITELPPLPKPVPASPQLRSPTSPTSRKEIIRPKSKPPPLPPSVQQLKSPSSPPPTSSPLISPRPSSASSTRPAPSLSSTGLSRSSEMLGPSSSLQRSHSQSSTHQRQQQQQYKLTEADIAQVEMFYRSHKTEVFVCQCMANLYEGTLRSRPSQHGGPPTQVVEIWNFIKPGIPVFILDSGESRRNRKLSIVLSEQGTGFPLWKETMSHLTNYRAEKGSFHTMHLSSDHNRMMALSFDDSVAANEFIHILQSILSNPNDDILNLSGRNKKKKDSRKPKQKYKAPAKSDISSPCCFTHVTNLNATDNFTKIASPTPPPPSRSGSQASHSTSSLPRPRSIPTT